MQNSNRVIGWITIGGLIGFISIVGYLQVVQQGYDPVQQLMSELALGRHGKLMLFAFFSFAVSVFAAQIGLHQCKAPVIIRLFLVTASISLFGAGVFDLGSAAVLHIILVAISFVLIVFVAYLLPRYVPAFKTPAHKRISWSLGAFTALSIALGQNLIPMGIGQRGAALCIIVWLGWMGYRFMRIKSLN